MAFHLTKKRTKGFSVGTADSLTLLIWLAEQKGFFSDEKVNIRVKAFPYSRKAMDLMLEEKLECAALVETNTALSGNEKIPDFSLRY